MNKPNFYIVGAPKCGTTAFDFYLSQHPQIKMLPKELHYWGEDIIYREGKISQEKYLDLINKHYEKNKLLGEGAVWYLSSKTTANELKEFTPNAKILIFLRNPVEAIYSLYYNTNYNGDDTSSTFEEALNNQEKRKNILPEYYNCPSIAFQYQRVYLYFEQVKRYFDVFGRENVHIVLYEEFLKDKQKSFSKVLQFLGVSDLTLDFKVINQNSEIKYASLRKLTNEPNKLLKSITKLLLPNKPIREGIKKAIWKVNTKHTIRPEMNSETKIILTNFYKNDIEKLSQLINVDLVSLWR